MSSSKKKLVRRIQEHLPEGYTARPSGKGGHILVYRPDGERARHADTGLPVQFAGSPRSDSIIRMDLARVRRTGIV